MSEIISTMNLFETMGVCKLYRTTWYVHENLDHKSKKMYEILEGSKSYVMLDGQADRGFAKIESCNVDFLERFF